MNLLACFLKFGRLNWLFLIYPSTLCCGNEADYIYVDGNSKIIFKDIVDFAYNHICNIFLCKYVVNLGMRNVWSALSFIRKSYIYYFFGELK